MSDASIGARATARAAERLARALATHRSGHTLLLAGGTESQRTEIIDTVIAAAAGKTHAFARTRIGPRLSPHGAYRAERTIAHSVARAMRTDTNVDSDAPLPQKLTNALDSGAEQRLTLVITDADALGRAAAAGAHYTLGDTLERALATEPRLTLIACAGRPLASPGAPPQWPYTRNTTTVSLPTPTPVPPPAVGRWPFGDAHAPPHTPAVVPERFANTPIAIVLMPSGPITSRRAGRAGTLRIESARTGDSSAQAVWITDDNGHECDWYETRILAHALDIETAPTLWTSSGSSVRAIDRALLHNAREHHTHTGTHPTLLLRAEAANARANHAAALYRPAPNALVG